MVSNLVVLLKSKVKSSDPFANWAQVGLSAQRRVMAAAGNRLILGGDLRNPQGGWESNSYGAYSFLWTLKMPYSTYNVISMSSCFDSMAWFPPNMGTSFGTVACSANVLASYLMTAQTATHAAWPSDDACGWSGFGPWSEADCHSTTVEVYSSVSLGFDIQYGMQLPDGTTRSWATQGVVMKDVSNPGQYQPWLLTRPRGRHGGGCCSVCCSGCPRSL